MWSERERTGRIEGAARRRGFAGHCCSCAERLQLASHFTPDNYKPHTQSAPHEIEGHDAGEAGGGGRVCAYAAQAVGVAARQRQRQGLHLGHKVLELGQGIVGRQPSSRHGLGRRFACGARGGGRRRAPPRGAPSSNHQVPAAAHLGLDVHG